MISKEARELCESFHAKCLREGQYDLSNLSVNLKLIEIAKEQGVYLSKGKLLEIGSGSGLMLRHLEREGSRITGIDLSLVQLDYCSSQEPKTAIARADALRLPFPDSSFHAVLSFDSLEHVSSFSQLTQEISRVMKPDGTFIFRTPNVFFSVPYELIKGLSLAEQKIFHPQLQSYHSLRRQLRNSGFDLNLFKLPIAEGRVQERLAQKLGSAAKLAQMFPWKILPLPIYPIFYGIASKADNH